MDVRSRQRIKGSRRGWQEAPLPAGKIAAAVDISAPAPQGLPPARNEASKRGRNRMAIVISAEIRVAPEDLPKIRAFAAVMVEKTNTLEKGPCIAYAFSEDFNEPGLVRAFEVWESDEALAAHFRTPHMADFQQAMKGITVLGVEAMRYELGAYGPFRP
jgi:quinol monooxygenase YgiN